MPKRAADHKVKLTPVWAPDKHTSDLLGTRCRRIVRWRWECSRCDAGGDTPTWSDARRFGRNHRTAEAERNG